MNEKSDKDIAADKTKQEQQQFYETIERKAQRRIRARAQDEQQCTWFGLGMFGLVGWSVAIPTLLGLALGLWIDSHFPGELSWTLILLIVGLVFGCLNAWKWVSEQRHQCHSSREE